MSNEKDTSKEPLLKEGFMRRARNFMTAMGLIASTATVNANTLPNDVENKGGDEVTSGQTYAEGTVSEKGKTYNIDVTRTVEEDELEGDLTVNTVVNEELEKGKTKHTRKEETEECYSLSSGNIVETTTEKVTVVKRKSGMVKSSTEERSSALRDESGAVNRAMGHEYVAETGSYSMSRDEFDRQGRYDKSEIHSVTMASGLSLRRDEVSDHGYVRNGELVDNQEAYVERQGISATAKLDVNTGKGQVQISADKGGRGFSANIIDGVFESYGNWNGEVGRRITVKDNEVSVNSTDGKEFSRKKAERELKKARATANILLKKVTRGEVSSVSEYLSTLPQYNIDGTKPSSGEYFDKRVDDRAIAREKDAYKGQHEENVKNAKSVTAQDIADLKMKEL